MSFDVRESLILIVEDNYNNVQYIGKLLTEENYEIAVALSGERALSFLKEKKPDMILLDVMMPDINGYDLCRNIREDPSNQNIPIIFLTAKSEKEDIIKGLKLGAVDYIPRPCNSLELMARINTHLEIKHLREKFYQQSIKDDLTSIYNRRFFLESLEREWERARRYESSFSISLMDIDDFKKINDSFGHLTGDLVLKSISSLLSDALRKTDIIGRFGGDEFAILFPQTDADHAQSLLQRFRKDHLSKIALHTEGVSCTMSFGIAQYQGNIDSIETMIGNADSALYMAKNRGKDQIAVF